MMEEAKKGTQNAALHFVNLALTSSSARLPVRNAEEERLRRSHVMKDYLRQKVQSPQSRGVTPVITSFSDHVNRFRLQNSKQSRRRTKQAAKQHGSASSQKRSRELIPKDAQSLDEMLLARSLANDTFHNVQSPIDITTPGTLALLEYYHTSFWDNSLACNPEGQWLSVALSDPAMLHATLCLVALHKIQTHGGLEADAYFRHRGEAMRLISRSLADPAHATSDATIGAVAVLSSSDNSVSCYTLFSSISATLMIPQRTSLHATREVAINLRQSTADRFRRSE